MDLQVDATAISLKQDLISTVKGNQLIKLELNALRLMIVSKK